MSLLLEAIQAKNVNEALRLLQDEKVKAKASENNNEALREATLKRLTTVALELLKLPAVRENAAALDNYALRFAATSALTPLALELLKLPAVRENAAAKENLALCWAGLRRDWSVVLELLKIEAVKNHLAAQNHTTLRTSLGAPELGIASLIVDIYNEKGIPIPDDLTADFKNQSETLLSQNKKIEDMALLVRDIYKNDGAHLLTLLEDKRVEAHTTQGNNLALVFASRKGLIHVVSKLIDIKAVADTAAVNNNEALRMAALYGHRSIITTLLKLAPVRGLVATKAHEALVCSVRFGHWSVALLLIRTYKEERISLPPDLEYNWGESTQSLSTLEKGLRTVYEGACDALPFSRSLINLVFEFASLPTILDLTASAPALLLSGGSASAPSQETSEVKTLIDDLQTLRELVSQSENKEAIEGHLNKIVGFIADNPRLSFEMLDIEGNKLASIIHDWFSGYEGLYERLRGIFKVPTKATLATS